MAADRILVIGAGMGGLAAAAELAHRGCDVTLCEAHAHTGGKIRQARIAGHGIDVGPTVFTMRWVFEALFERLGERLSDHLTLHASPTLARHHWPDGSRLDLHADPDASESAVAEFAGGDEAARFRAFSARARRLFEGLRETFMERPKPSPLGAAMGIGPDLGLLSAMGPGRTLWQALCRDLKDPRLRQLFGRYATYVGGSPFSCPAHLMLIWHAEACGVWHLEGGMAALPRALARIAEARGARIRTNTPIAEILVRRGRVTGARLASGEIVEADRVIFNGDAGALAAGHLGRGVRRAVGAVPREARSLSALTLAMVAEPEGAALSHHTVFFSDDYRAEFDALAARRLPPVPTTYLCAGARGGGATPSGPEPLFAIINAPPTGDTSPQRPEEIDRCQDAAFALLSRSGLRLAPQQTEIVRTAPAGFERLFPGTGGALYGRSPAGMMSAFARPGSRTAVKGLYLAGGSAHPGAGVPMATLSGGLAAAAVISDLASTRGSILRAISGGISTRSRMTAPAR